MLITYLLLLFGATPPAVNWNSASARNQVLAALQSQGNKPDDPICEIQTSHLEKPSGDKCSLRHQVLGEYDLPYKTRRAKLIIAGSWDPAHNCDGCGQSLSLFEFRLGDRGWQLTHSDFGVGEWGKPGGPNASPFALRVVSLGDDVPGIYAVNLVKDGEQSFGSTDIYARFEDGYIFVGMIDSSYDSGGPEKDRTRWETAISVDPSPARLHDLIVTRTGTENGKKVSTKLRYRFDGTQYIARVVQ